MKKSFKWIRWYIDDHWDHAVAVHLLLETIITNLRTNNLTLFVFIFFVFCACCWLFFDFFIFTLQFVVHSQMNGNFPVKLNYRNWCIVNAIWSFGWTETNPFFFLHFPNKSFHRMHCEIKEFLVEWLHQQVVLLNSSSSERKNNKIKTKDEKREKKPSPHTHIFCILYSLVI